MHNVTVYAKDKEGYTGTSETVYFSISEPFPTNLVIAVISASATVAVGAGLFVYFKKIRRQTHVIN